MKLALATFVAVAAVAASAASALGAEPIRVAGPIVVSATPDLRSAYVTSPDPAYIRYADSSVALPGPNCYWTRMPVYDLANNVIGWRGRPVAVCP